MKIGDKVVTHTADIFNELTGTINSVHAKIGVNVTMDKLPEGTRRPDNLNRLFNKEELEVIQCN